MPHVSGYPLSSGTDLLVTESWTNQKLGQLARSADGNEYRSVRAGAVDLVVGTLLQSPVFDANFAGLAIPADVPVSTTGSGPTIFTVTNGATPVTADMFSQGTVTVSFGAGIGQTFKVLSNTAALAGDPFQVTVEEPVSVALETATTLVTLEPSPYDGVLVFPTPATGMPVGVAITPIKAGEYGWVQTKGVCAVLADATPALVGGVVEASVVTPGAVTLYTAGSLPALGVATVDGVSTQTRQVFLNL